MVFQVSKPMTVLANTIISPETIFFKEVVCCEVSCDWYADANSKTPHARTIAPAALMISTTSLYRLSIFPVICEDAQAVTGSNKINKNDNNTVIFIRSIFLLFLSTGFFNVFISLVQKKEGTSLHLPFLNMLFGLFVIVFLFSLINSECSQHTYTANYQDDGRNITV